MTAAELVAAARRWLNDETVATYKWTAAEIYDYYNYAMDEIARETDYFTDVTTAATVNIALTAGTADYAFATNVLEIKSARIAGETTNLEKTTSRLRDIELPTWRYSNAVSGIDITFTTSTIASTTTDFLDAGFADEEFYQILGSTTTANNKVVKIDTIAQYLLTLNSSYSFTAATDADRIVIKQLKTDTPTKYMTDYRLGYLTLDPAPDAAGSLLVDVIRLQAELLSAATLATHTIPISYQYHLQLLDGILSKAYLKSGPSTFNYEKAELHRQMFIALKDRIKRDMDKLGNIRSTLRPHDGTI